MLENVNGLKVYKCDRLEKYSDKIKYFVTTRLGGVSKYPYNTLNISFKNENDRESSDINLDIACEKLDFTKENVVCVYENHTDKVLVITEENKEKYLFNKHHKEIYDAMITNAHNIPLLITVADCNAIVMYDTKNNVVANIHSGWKGTVQKIYLKTLAKMKETYGTLTEDVVCIYSPTIQSCSWKTKDKDLVESFKKYWEDIPLEDYTYEDKEEYIHVDFTYPITYELLKAGVKEDNIINEKICTACNNDVFFSYRKKTELNEPDFGTQACIVELK